MKTIGVLGGMGWEGSASYYRIMNREVRERLGGWHCARIILDSLDFDSIARAQSREEFEGVQATLIESAQRLEQAGAALLVIACNTVHRFAQSIEDSVSIPLLHIADASGEVLASEHHQRVGLLGTRATMQGAFYRKRLAQRFGLDVVIPNPATIKQVNHMILHELASGSSPTSAKPIMDKAVDQLVEDGCTAVLLACTEFGLVYQNAGPRIEGERVPLFDTAVIHSIAAIDISLA